MPPLRQTNRHAIARRHAALKEKSGDLIRADTQLEIRDEFVLVVYRNRIRTTNRPTIYIFKK